MIIEKTLDFLRSHDGERLESLVILDVRIGLYLTAVKLSDGSVGVASTLNDTGTHCHIKKRRYGPFSPLQIRQRKAIELLQLNDSHPLSDSLKLAVLNAFSVHWINSGIHHVHEDQDPIDLIDWSGKKKIAMVGAFQSYIRRLADQDHHLTVLEFHADNLAPEHRHLYMHTGKASAVIPEADVVILTGMTLLNRTADDLLGMTNSGQQVVVSGPSGSIVPEVLFRRNVGIIGATRVTKPEYLLELVGEAGTGYHLFQYCARKICITP